MKDIHNLRIFVTSIIAANAVGAASQTCADLSIASVSYSAFYDSLIEVRLLNSGPIAWDYPSLIVYDPNGDTLAFHGADLFALTTDQTIVLPFADGAAIPIGPTTGTVELWTGFNTTLECTFDVTFDLCPAVPCLPLRPFLFTNNADVDPADIAWHLEDSVGTTVATGSFHLDSTHTYVSDSACVAPGNYSIVIDPPWADADHLYFGIGSSAWNSPTLQAHLIDTTTIAFTLLGSCTEGTNAIPEETPASIQLTMTDGELTITSAQDAVLERIELWDARGILILVESIRTNVARIDLRDKAAGVYPVRIWMGGSPISTRVMVPSAGR
ncbi:MAG: T9SS type A sorting domain-containing protein [Flavobacteriales bacterium]|nr:T9SS type A sorting domain-containing protein [Flavobacteriales bacterium]